MPNKPMIELEQTPDPKKGGVPVLSYNVPEPTSYTGKNFIELDFIPKGKNPTDYFKPDCFKSEANYENQEFNKLKSMDQTALKDKIATEFKSGIGNSILTNAKLNTSFLKLAESPTKALSIDSNLSLSNGIQSISPDEVATQIKNGLKLNVYRNMFGDLVHNYIPAKPKVIRPRIVLVETYKLSSFLGAYGAGRTIKTFSLLPGEKTKISVKTYHKTETSSKQASSILDSFTSESSSDFENAVSSENSTKQNESESFEYHAEAEAEASWGWGSAKVSGGVKGGSNSSREEFSKNLQNATSKHAAKASSKRDVQINTSTEVKESTGEETEIVREIENINVSRTLNFVFRQMNQEFITIQHLVDLRLAFFNGESKSKTEFTLPELDNLIDQYIVDDATKRKEVKDAILNQLLFIKDYQDNQPTGLDEDGNSTGKAFIQQKNLLDLDNKPVNPYYQFSKSLYSLYKDQTGREILVQGIIISVKKHVMRTEGVIVDSILGQGDALDTYSHGLQDEEIRTKKLANDLKEKEIEKYEIAKSILEKSEVEKGAIFSQLYPNPNCCCCDKESTEK
ncbi:hypothetical protein ACFVRR_18200 [Gottfriedia sp. NPDC057948]|uniref:hypothetical protein n=1 Tax=Gottfriedia sp. NPDC057948 TaxID=3346287 RepID=UPI0036D7B836